MGKKRGDGMEEVRAEGGSRNYSWELMYERILKTTFIILIVCVHMCLCMWCPCESVHRVHRHWNPGNWS